MWLGEHHNSVADHILQSKILRKIHALRRNRPTAIGLEQVQVQFQPVLDDFNSGKISMSDMRKKVEWDKRWTWSFDGYQPVFETARELNVPLLALNVNSEDLALVEKDGLPGLTQECLQKYIKDP